MSLVEQLRTGAGAVDPARALVFDEHIVSAIPGAETASGTSQERYKLWRASRTGARPTEYLLPRIVREVACEWPRFMHRSAPDVSVDDLRAKLAELGPWYVPFSFAGEVNTMEFTDNFGAAIFAEDNAQRMQFRTELIGGTLERLLGDELAQMSVLDIGCNSGWFSFDLAERGARSVDGVDLRPSNIEQARYLSEYFGLDDRTDFDVADAMAFSDERSWDVVLNLGVLYHVTDPLRLLQRTYELCRRFAIVDTICHDEPFSGFVLFDTKDASHPHEGSEAWEFHPTYRGAIDGLRYAGCSEVIEGVPTDDTAIGLYRDGGRRCFLAVK